MQEIWHYKSFCMLWKARQRVSKLPDMVVSNIKPSPFIS